MYVRHFFWSTFYKTSKNRGWVYSTITWDVFYQTAKLGGRKSHVPNPESRYYEKSHYSHHKIRGPSRQLRRTVECNFDYNPRIEQSK